MKQKRIICRKYSYRTEAEAKAAIDKINAENQGSGNLLKTAYHCPDCKWWHITKISRNQRFHIEAKDQHRNTATDPDQDMIQGRLEYLRKKNKGT